MSHKTHEEKFDRKIEISREGIFPNISHCIFVESTIKIEPNYRRDLNSDTHHSFLPSFLSAFVPSIINITPYLKSVSDSHQRTCVA